MFCVSCPSPEASAGLTSFLLKFQPLLSLLFPGLSLLRFRGGDSLIVNTQFPTCFLFGFINLLLSICLSASLGLCAPEAADGLLLRLFHLLFMPETGHSLIFDVECPFFLASFVSVWVLGFISPGLSVFKSLCPVDEDSPFF